jgi:hypothetical protein
MRTLVFASAVGLAAMLATEAPGAGGAYVVDDAAVDEPGACKIESSASFASNSDLLGLVTPACVVSLFRPVELGIVGARSRQDGEWGSSVLPKAKINILPPEAGKLGLALSGGSQFDLLTGHYTGSFVNVPATWTFSETFKANVNVGWIYEHQANQHFLSYGAGLEWLPMKAFTLIAEVFGLAGPGGDTRGVTQPRFQAGLRITPVDTIDFDMIYGRNILAENANWITIGMNVRFPVPGK